MSTVKDRLFEVYEAYRHALEKRPTDLKEATTSDQVRKILANLDRLQTKYFEAVLQELSATGPVVEAAYLAAKKANSKTREAYQDAKELADRIGQVGKLVTAINNLVKTARA